MRKFLNEEKLRIAEKELCTKRKVSHTAPMNFVVTPKS